MRGVGDHKLDSAPVYGHTSIAGGVFGSGGRIASVFDGDFDWEFVRKESKEPLQTKEEGAGVERALTDSKAAAFSAGK